MISFNRTKKKVQQQQNKKKSENQIYIEEKKIGRNKKR